VGALADGDEILATAATVAQARPRPSVSAPRSVTLKGFADPVDVVSVKWD
jgi:class 3 adenylate cyclase